MLIRKYALPAAILLVIWGLWLLWLWQPERQVRLHTIHFLKKVERRNWDAAGVFMADDFTTRWGHDKASALHDAREVFSQFFLVTIESHPGSFERDGATGTIHVGLKIHGQGGPFGDLISGKINELHEPFSFTWRHAGAAPWKWELIRVDQSELDIGPNPSL